MLVVIGSYVSETIASPLLISCSGLLNVCIEQDMQNVNAAVTDNYNITQSNKKNIVSNTESIVKNRTDIAINRTGIVTNRTDIAINRTGIVTNRTNIAINRTDIAANSARIGGAENRISALEQNTSAEFSRLRRDMEDGIAMVAAMETFLPSQNKNYILNVGFGHYRNSTALGISFAGRINDSTTTYIGVASSIEGRMGAAKVGMNFQW